jgi:hypothetical protein
LVDAAAAACVTSGYYLWWRVDHRFEYQFRRCGGAILGTVLNHLPGYPERPLGVTGELLAAAGPGNMGRTGGEK